MNIGFGVTGRIGTTVHATTDNLITIEGDEATQLSHMLVFRQVPRAVVRDGLIIATERFEDRHQRGPDSSLRQVGWVNFPLE